MAVVHDFRLEPGGYPPRIHTGPAVRPAVPKLIELLKVPEARYAAATALGALGPAAKQAEAPLREALKVPDRHFQRAVRTALEKIRAAP